MALRRRSECFECAASTGKLLLQPGFFSRATVRWTCIRMWFGCYGAPRDSLLVLLPHGKTIGIRSPAQLSFWSHNDKYVSKISSKAKHVNSSCDLYSTNQKRPTAPYIWHELDNTVSITDTHYSETCVLHHECHAMAREHRQTHK